MMARMATSAQVELAEMVALVAHSTALSLPHREAPATPVPLDLDLQVVLVVPLVWLSLAPELVVLVVTFLDLPRSPGLPGFRVRSSSTGNELQIQILAAH